MPPKSPRHPYIRSVRREIDPPRPKRPARRWGRRLRAALLLALLAGGGWYLWQKAGAPVERPLTAVRVGAVEEALEVDALIVRKEQVVTAPVSGQVRRLVAEGDRVRVGAAVVEISPGPAPAASASPSAQPSTSAGTPGSVAAARREFDRLSGEIFQLVTALNQATSAGETQKAAQLQEQVDQLSRRQTALVRMQGQASSPDPGQAGTSPTPVPTAPTPGATPVPAPVAGIVLYQIDGLESALSLEGADRWSPSWLRSLPFPEAARAGEQGAAVGQPLFKVVDDLDLELIAVVPASRLSPSQRTIMAQDGVTVRLAGRDRSVKARVRRMAEEGDELLLHLTVPQPLPEALRVRRMRVTLLLDTVEGMVVPRSAIDVQEGLTGVWVATGAAYRFVPVQVLGGNRNEVAVKGDLAPDAQVLRELPAPAP